VIGKEQGLSEEEIFSYQFQADTAHQALKDLKETGEIGFMDLPEKVEEARAITEKAGELRHGVEACLVLGIGGSSLGGRALRDAIKTPLYNELPGEKRDGLPRLYFAENIDPETFAQLLGVLNPARTLVVVISKSGGTAETMSQFLITMDWLKGNLGNSYSNHIVAITDPAKGALREIAVKEGFETFSIPPNVGGRFSVLTPVGLFPAAMIGIDIVALLKGAAAMAKRCASPELKENPAYLNAVIHYLYDVKKKKPLSVLMPYADSLLSLADWYRQLYAESLGKRVNQKGEEVFSGPTPIRALGATDQHSQLQLYMEGPFDKIVTFIRVEACRKDVTIPYPLSYETPLDYLQNHTLGQLIGFEQFATAHALRHNQRPTVVLSIDKIDEFSLGQLLYFYELQVAFQGQLYGINPFNQPGVELGKKLTYGLMGRKGYEQYVKDLEK
ncbi:MAG: glucose-6-phosphate isomerase, partial [Deltaproteobacteria bacterium]